jgi:hypothetical protein
MGLTKLIGSAPTCLVPRETRGEQQRAVKNRQGKNNSQGFKTSPGQHRAKSGQGQKTPIHKKGLTRFSDNQFSGRKKKK